ncbi:MAG: ATP-dependent zinc protease [Proteobacteria bacterium]|nr:ATP-dependent zinc protease [Pseudomonadota bacterium]
MQEPIVMGWEEWLALPELGLPAIKAKIDTGARTSALAAFNIEEIGGRGTRRVRFDVRPIPGRDDVVVNCIADVVDCRDVTSSSGESEKRYIIRTTARVGTHEWPIEISLASRNGMTYRMLLGRQAVRDDMVVDPATSFVQPQLSYRSYGAAMRTEPAQRPLTIALLSRRPENPSNRRLVRQAELRGHAMPIIDRRRLSLYIAASEPAILVNGLPLDPPDAVIFRAGKNPSQFSLAIIRQLEMLGALALNPIDALEKAGNALVLRQTLAGAGVAVPEVAVNPRDVGKGLGAGEHVLADSLGTLGSGALLRFAVVGGRSLAAIERPAVTTLDQSPDWQAAERSGAETASARKLAERAARTIGLGLATVDVAIARTGPLVIDVTANVSLSQLERLTGVSLAEAVIVHIERTVAARDLVRQRAESAKR